MTLAVAPTITMYDTAWNTQFPPGGQAYAAYVDGAIGDQPNYDYVVATFPGAHHLSITLFPDRDADALDIENGAATVEEAAGWYERQVARGAARPCFYASASRMEAQVIPVITAARFPRGKVRLWAAHYGAGEHICAPGTCGLMSMAADGTQWTDTAMGKTLDQSLLEAGFFGPPVPVPPVPAWQEDMMKALPVVKKDSKDTAAVRTVQGLCVARGHAIKVDGVFGPLTDAAVQAVQAGARILVDGVVGPQTWPALMATA